MSISWRWHAVAVLVALSVGAFLWGRMDGPEAAVGAIVVLAVWAIASALISAGRVKTD